MNGAPRITITSFRTPRRLVPSQARRLRSRSVALAPGAVTPWHSTGRREELLLVLRGAVTLQHRGRPRRLRSTRLIAGQAVFVPSGVEHQVVNRSRSRVRYVYVTG